MGQAKPQDIQVAAITMMMSVMIMMEDNVSYRIKPPPTRSGRRRGERVLEHAQLTLQYDKL